MEQQTEVTISTNERHLLSSSQVFWFEFVRATLFLAFGGWIMHVLYYYCLFNTNTNPIVTVYFCLLSLGCFISVGIPIDKLANISLTGK